MKVTMRNTIMTVCAVVSMVPAAMAQLTTPADGTSARARVSERIGLTDVSVSYGRPAVKGREGKIWGGLVHVGFKNLGYGNGKESPWRAGANENTTIEFSTDVMIEGKQLAAGKYGFFVAYQPDYCTLIFSRSTGSWGSYFYEPDEDVLRVNVKPVALLESRERLTFQFGGQTDSSAVISLEWEKLGVPFRVSTKLHELQMASFDKELKGEKGFDPHALVQVADYLMEHNTRLEDALGYVNRASQSMPVFSVLIMKSTILSKLNRQTEADSIKLVAMERGTASDIHNYARGLLREGKKDEAYAVFEKNYKMYPKLFTTNVGMVRGCSAKGKVNDAVKYAKKALPLAPDANNKKVVEDMLAMLKEGKEVSTL